MRRSRNVKSLSAVTRCIVVVYAILLLSVLVSCAREQEKSTVAQPADGAASSGTTVVATIAEEDTPPPVVPGHETDPAMPGQPASFQVIFSATGGGAAYLTSKNGNLVVVHNRSRSKEYAAVNSLVLSSDGRRIAYAAQVGSKWHMVVDGREGRGYDALLAPLFSPDGQHVVYQAKEGNRWYLVADNRQNSGTIASYTTPEFSADSTLIAFVEAAASNSKMRLIVSDLTFGTQSVTWSIGDQLFTTNKNRTRIVAVQAADKKFRTIAFNFAIPAAVHTGPLYDVIENLTVSDDGMSISYCALKGRNRLVVLDDRVEPLPLGRTPELPVIHPDKKGVGMFLGLHNRISLHQAFIAGKEKGASYDEAASLAYSTDGRSAFAARKGNEWFVVVNGTEGSAFDRVVDPIFSPDGRYVVYRARTEGQRFVVVADAKDGRIIRRHPSYEKVFQPVFTAAGTSIEYGVKDGNKLLWKVESL